MAQETYTLEWILPHVREALKRTSNFEFRIYANALFQQLERSRVEGVVSYPPGQNIGGQLYQYDRIPFEIRSLVSEAFFYMFHKGYIAPAAPDSRLNPPPLHMFNITQRGRTWLGGGEPLPEDAERYMTFLRAHIPTLDPVIDQYVVEALAAFGKEALFASAVMLGAASEKEVYLLADSVLTALKDAKRQAKLKGLLDRRKLLDLFEMVRDTIDGAAAGRVIPYAVTEGAATHLMSLFEAARVQRNDAVHPMNAQVSEESVRHSLQSLPYVLAKSEEIRAWLVANPGSI